MYQTYLLSEHLKPKPAWPRLLLLALLFLFAQFSFAQTAVTGKVLDEGGLPVIRATVTVKGTTAGTVTDNDGNFRLTVPAGASILVISYTGSATQEIALDGRTEFNVALTEGLSTVNEVVVVAYGVQKKATLTGAVVAIGGRDLIKSPAVDISNSLAGRLPGVVVIQTSGEPGYDGATINIRGINTLGNSSPLVVIDGIPDRDRGFGI